MLDSCARGHGKSSTLAVSGVGAESIGVSARAAVSDVGAGGVAVSGLAVCGSMITKGSAVTAMRLAAAAGANCSSPAWKTAERQ